MSTNRSQPDTHFTRWDALVAAVIAALAVLLTVSFYGGRTQSTALTVVISVAGEELQRTPLDNFTDTTVTNGGCTLHITAADNGVQVSDSTCPTQDCVHTGVISRAGQSIVCLPAQVVVHLEGAADTAAPDVIVG